MCCRYWLEESNELKPIVDQMMKSSLVIKWYKSYAAPIKSSGEIRPADLAPVIAMNRSGKKSVFPMKWGFTEKSLLMNARVELPQLNLPSKRHGRGTGALSLLHITLNGNT